MSGDKKEFHGQSAWDMLGHAQFGTVPNCQFEYVSVSCLSLEDITGTLTFPNILDAGEPLWGIVSGIQRPSAHPGKRHRIIQSSLCDVPCVSDLHPLPLFDLCSNNKMELGT